MTDEDLDRWAAEHGIVLSAHPYDRREALHRLRELVIADEDDYNQGYEDGFFAGRDALRKDREL